MRENPPENCKINRHDGSNHGKNDFHAVITIISFELPHLCIETTKLSTSLNFHLKHFEFSNDKVEMKLVLLFVASKT